ncbi:hypothetical protein PQX77_018556 [Marasmius sp. AFHP31]|nr:hypothetical protein PQX77_018556 [Marasmius sp. AFHP31]
MDRTLFFNYRPGNLTKDVKVVMVFDAPTNGELTEDQSHVAWKVATLKARSGSSACNSFRVDYNDTLGFGVVQPTNGKIVVPNSIIGMKAGEVAELIPDGPSPMWSEPGKLTEAGTIIRATNRAGVTHNIALGTVKDLGYGIIKLVPTFMWKVGNGLTAEANFRPRLNLYANIDCQGEFLSFYFGLPRYFKLASKSLTRHGLEHEFMKSDRLTSIEPIWSADLSALGPTTEFLFSESPKSPEHAQSSESSESPESPEPEPDYTVTLL